MWTPPQTTRPPLRTTNSAGTSAPTRAKMMAASSSFGARTSAPPAQTAPPRAGEALRRRIFWMGEGEDAPPLPARHLRHLRHDVGRRAEAVEAKARRFPTVWRAVADQPGAEQRRELRVRRPLRQREDEARILGVAAVDRVA